MSMVTVLTGVSIAGISAFFACFFALYWVGAARMNPWVRFVLILVGGFMWLAAAVALSLLFFHEAARFWGLM